VEYYFYVISKATSRIQGGKALAELRDKARS